jgi:outer membrane lipoprotein carrier protein
MELHDAFGHQTVLRFTELKNNPSLPSQLFKFVPPKGADVLGE